MGKTGTELRVSEQEGEIVKARLKWFNAAKGFGFVVPEDNTVDAFLHITTLQQAGVFAIGEGACVLCRMVDGPKGCQITEVIEVIDMGNVDESALPPGPGEEKIETMSGSVKWYKQDKGFGFIVPEDGMKDIFVHKSCLDRLGIETLETGQHVVITVRSVPKGREAIAIELNEVSD